MLESMGACPTCCPGCASAVFSVRRQDGGEASLGFLMAVSTAHPHPTDPDAKDSQGGRGVSTVSQDGTGGGSHKMNG